MVKNTKLKPLINEDQIQRKISDIANKMNKDFQNNSRVLFLVILKGSFIFASDLIRKLKFDFEIDFLRVSSYRESMVSGDIEINDHISSDLKDRHVIILEDILDTGNTVTAICKMLKNKGVNQIDISAIFVKEGKYTIPIEVKYPGIIIENQFVVGYGLDFAGKYRNLPYLAILLNNDANNV